MELPHTFLNGRLFGLFLFHAIFFFTCFSLLFFAESANAIENRTDELALLAFKDQISSDPNKVLSLWNNSVHFCMWAGVTCSKMHPQRVTALNLEGQSLEGSLSPHFANLSFLRNINLSNNSLHGHIPQEIGQLLRLRILNLVNNSFSGEIPKNLSQCSNLRLLSLYGNKLVGGIPFELGSLSKLYSLDLTMNNLTGDIPPALGNLSSIIYLQLGKNALEGNIPHDLGRLLKMKVLALGLNKLTGIIPTSLYNVSSLFALELGSNHLHGTLPPDLGNLLPNLEWLSVAKNSFTGPLPVSLANASRIVHLELGWNNFIGSVPMDLGRLQRLQWLNLASNLLGQEKDDDMSFIASLTNCSDLNVLTVRDNLLSGLLPDSIANLSSHLWWLYLGQNQISGTIPSGIEKFVSLTGLGLYQNLLEGIIPLGLGNLRKLQGVYLGQNKLTGQIPTSLGNLTALVELYLEENNLQGSIPWSLGKCQHLEKLGISKNSLNGSIPEQVLNIPPLRELDLGMNSLTGPLPMAVGGLNNLEMLDVSNNKFSGEIPSTLGTCVGLQYLNMRGNFFQGRIPLSLSTLKGIQELDLSYNNLSGRVPKYMEEFRFLHYLNLSFNNLEGEVPYHGIFQNASAISVIGNEKLCGGITKLHLPPCAGQDQEKHGKALPLKAIISGVVTILSLFLLILCFLANRYRLKNSNKEPPRSSMRKHFLEVTYPELLKATNGFSSANLIGDGSFGFVYKGVLDQMGQTIAIKVFKSLQLQAAKSFMVECNALKRIRHRNIVKILTVCSSMDFEGNDFKALVFDYMPNGSLDAWLHPIPNEDQPSKFLTFNQRLSIAIHVASALDYLHHHCQEPVVHCDLKPSNVLLDDDMVAQVGDFGLARIFSEDAVYCSQIQSSSVGIKGTIGYVAPEYGMGGEVSTYGDVYSYGILLLEMFTGKRPTDDDFKNNLTLHQFAKMALPGRIMEIIDRCLLLEITEVISGNENCNEVRHTIYECLVSLVRLGVSCSVDAPKERVNMQDVVLKLHEVRDFYLGVGKFKAKNRRDSSLLEGPSYISAY